MHWLNYSLLVITLWAAYWQNSVAETESSNKTEECTTAVNPKENEILIHPLEPESNYTPIAITDNHTAELIPDNATKIDDASTNSGLKGDPESITFNDIKPFLLFPILPYLFPPKEEEGLNLGKDELSTPKNDTSKINGNPADGKPFIFFDFAFNIRQIPIKNATEKLNDSKIIDVKKLSTSNDADDSKSDTTKNRRRRNTKADTPGFFDDAPLFPDSELDEFLPKPDLFFPDLPFHHKTSKKLNRRKRDPKKTELKNDLKSFFDAFDEAFMRTKRELEWTDPLLNFLRGSEQAFDEDKKDGDDLFGQAPDIQEKPSVKWRIQRNIKRLNNDRQVGKVKAQDSPTIIVDKVVKIGEFHVHDDGHDKSKKKRGLIDSKRKFLGRDNHEELNPNKDQNISKSIFELIKQDKTKRKKRGHLMILNPAEEIPKKTDSGENKSTLQPNDLFHSASVRKTPESDEAGKKVDIPNTNNTEKLYSLMKMFDTMKGQMEQELKKNFQTQDGNNNQVDASNSKGLMEGNLQEGLKKNLTELLKQFIALNKNFEGQRMVDKPALAERDDSRLFDWAEKETSQNTNILGKGSGEPRQKKDAYFEDEYVNPKDRKKDRKIADLNQLFLNVTLPTVLVFGMILIACFFVLQAKGKVCAALFKRRQVLIKNDEATTQLNNSGSNKVQAI